MLTGLGSDEPLAGLSIIDQWVTLAANRLKVSVKDASVRLHAVPNHPHAAHTAVSTSSSADTQASVIELHVDR